MKEVLRLVFLRFCVSLRSLITGISFSFLPLLRLLSFILIMRRTTHILLLLFIFHFKVYVKKATESDFGI